MFTICGRAGSKGIKNKNIKNFLDKPLALYSLSVIDLYLKKSNYQADIFLNTDSKDLMDIFENNSLRCVNVVKRTPELSGDNVAKIDVINNCLIEMESRNNKEYDYIIDLDITSPLRTVNDLKAMIDKKINSDYDLIFSHRIQKENF